MTITLSFLLIGLAATALQVHGVQFLAHWRELEREFDRDFGTCDKVFSAYRHSSQPPASLAVTRPRRKYLS